MRSKLLAVAPVLLSLTASSPANAQPRSELDQIDSYLRGYQFLMTYRQGGPVYGKYYRVETHLCPSGRYFSQGSFERMTVLENTERGNWQERGQWKVGVYSGQPGVLTVSDEGRQDFTPFRLYHGRPWIGEGVKVARTGRAGCR